MATFMFPTPDFYNKIYYKSKYFFQQKTVSLFIYFIFLQNLKAREFPLMVVNKIGERLQK